MYQKLGIAGLVGVLVMLSGIAIIGLNDPTIALGVAAVIAGTGMVVYGLVQNVMAAFGMA